MKTSGTREPKPTEATLFARILTNGQGGLSVETAHYLLNLDFSAEDRIRMRELAAKARAGTLTRREREETRKYERTGNLLGVLKSKARKALKTGSGR